MGRRLTTALAAAASVAALAAGASSAQAAVWVTDTTPTDDQAVGVVGVAPTFSPDAATHYAVAECNVEGEADPADWGDECNGASGGTPPRFRSVTALGMFGTFATAITVDDQFTNVDFTGGPPPGTSTSCADVGSDQCAVVVSYYYYTGGTPQYQFLDAEKVDITF